MVKILSTYICWKKNIKCNIWRVAVRPSYIEDARFLKVKIVLRQFNCASADKQINFDSIKMHGMYVGGEYIYHYIRENDLYFTSWPSMLRHHVARQTTYQSRRYHDPQHQSYPHTADTINRIILTLQDMQTPFFLDMTLHQLIMGSRRFEATKWPQYQGSDWSNLKPGTCTASYQG
jgi:hypothetical protein